MDKTTQYFPPLFKKSETGAIIEWNISVEGNVISTSWGQEGGATQVNYETISEGKNIGKVNETSPAQQAVAEAKAKWEKQLKNRKYTDNKEDAIEGKRSDLVKGGFDCMLAHPIEKKPKALKFPCAVQRKYDGHRLLAVVDNGVCTLWSRSRKSINSLPHIQMALEEALPNGHHEVDGEAYSMKVTFEELTSFIRSSEPLPGHEIVEYHIYDVNITGMDYSHRFDWLIRHFDDREPLVLAPTVIVQDEVGMNKCFEEFLEAGYEGAMARNLAGLYVGKRSKDLLKLKKFQDAEFKVIGVTTDIRVISCSSGTKEMVYPKFQCIIDGWTGPGDEAHEFNTTLNGEQSEVRKYIDNPSLAIGRMLTVRFQNYTAEAKPRIPKALRFREDV